MIWSARALKPRLAQHLAKAQTAMLLGSFPRNDNAPRKLGRVAIVAALGRGNGISNGARLQAAHLRELGFDVELLDATAALRNPFHRVAHRAANAYVFHCGGPQTPSLISAVMPHAGRAWRIGYWAWELPEPPQDWNGFDRLVHEVWTPSRFARDSLRRLVDCPIEVVPHIVPVAPRRVRDGHGPFTVLAFADSRSSFTRKNPLGALASFRSAFGDDPGVRLVLKLNGAATDFAEIDQAVAGLPNVQVLRGFLDDAALQALLRSADALLSLHRAEGFGLPMLEAMAHGVPVVATAWSGNLDFMTSRNAALVPARLVPVQDAAGIYSQGVWAEPDIGIAAAALQRLRSDEDYWLQLSVAAHEAVAGMARRMAPALTRPETQRDQFRAALTARMTAKLLPFRTRRPALLHFDAELASGRMNGEKA